MAWWSLIKAGFGAWGRTFGDLYGRFSCKLALQGCILPGPSIGVNIESFSSPCAINRQALVETRNGRHLNKHDWCNFLRIHALYYE
jgi:hypothetical protein